MKLNVPFYRQTTPLNCGPVALKMAFSYLGVEIDTKEIEKAVGIKDGKAVSTTRLALASASFGFKTKILSNSLGIDLENLDLDFYKKYAEENYVKEQEKLRQEAISKGVEMQEKTISIQELLSYLNEDSIPIVLLDWNIISKKFGSYYGHFVPVVGYDEENIYIHNHDLANPREFMSIKKEFFDKARKAKGTDQDILIISRKTK